MKGKNKNGERKLNTLIRRVLYPIKSADLLKFIDKFPSIP